MRNAIDRLRFRRDHRWAPRRMSEYLDDELPARQRTRMEEHSAHCPECHGALHSLRRMLVFLHAVPPAGSPAHAADIAAAVRERLRDPSDR